MKARFAIALFGALLFGAPAAWAQATASPPALSEALTGDAKAAYESAKVLYKDGDFAGALLKFSAAYEKSSDPRLLWNMAACEKSLRHYSKALALVRTYATTPNKLVTDKERAEANELVKVMEPFTSKVHLTVSEPDATVSVDDDVIGTSPIEGPIVVDLTARRVHARKAGFQDATKELPTSAAESSIELVLVKVAHEGRVVVKAGAGDAIAVDGRPLGTGSWSGPLASGGHTLRITAPGMRAYQAEILVVDEQTREIAVTLEPEPSRLPTWAWIAGGVLVASGLGVGGYFLFRQDAAYEGPAGNLSPGIVQASTPIRWR